MVSSKLTSVTWPNTRILADLDAVAEMKREQGKDIYLMGGAAIVGAAIDAGLVDELRLIVYPLIVGEGKALFSSSARHAMELHKLEQRSPIAGSPRSSGRTAAAGLYAQACRGGQERIP